MSDIRSKLLSLVMIVKNEAACIAKTLDSVRAYVDEWIVLDTGSTDGTQEIVRSTMASTPGALHEEPFVDFATSRNRALELANARSPVFTLMLSADEVLERGDHLRAFLEAHQEAADGAYCLEMRSGPSRWFYPRVLRTGAGWRYVGRVHEVPVSPKNETMGPVVPGAQITHTASDPDRRFRRICDLDIPLLRADAHDSSKSLDERAASIFFLAQSIETVADKMPNEPGGERLSLQMEAMGLYFRYAQIVEDPKHHNHDPVKAHFAYFRYLNIAESVGFYAHDELIKRLSILAEAEPQLPEVRYMIAVHAAQLDARQGLYYAEQAAKTAYDAKKGEPLHVPTDTRVEWLSLRLAAACAQQLGRKDYARSLADRALSAGATREAVAEALAS